MPNIKKLLYISLFLSLLVIVRIFFSGKTSYFFLIWNLFLAWIPFVVSLLLNYVYQRKSRYWMLTLVLLGFLWLIFYPNAPYIVTDFIHLRPRPEIPLWFDAVLVTGYSLAGLILGFYSLYVVQGIVKKVYNQLASYIFVIVVNILSGFGIYLGRFLRWNSWDIVANPVQLFMDIADRLLNPFSHPRTIASTILFSCFLLAGYALFLSLINLDKGRKFSDKHEV